MRTATATGAALVWIPRRAGERGALEAGALPSLLPGGRPATDPRAREEVASVWGVAELPTGFGRDTGQILEAAATGELAALLVAGVDPEDLPDPAGALRALDEVGFLVSLELRPGAVTERADVVLPVAAVAEKSGTFLNWEGRARMFEAALKPEQLPRTLCPTDARVLHMLADALDVRLALPDLKAARRELDRLGGRQDGFADDPRAASRPVPRPADGEAVLAGHRMLLDRGRLQEGDEALAGTRHAAVARLSPATAAESGVKRRRSAGRHRPRRHHRTHAGGHRDAGPGGVGAAQLRRPGRPRRHRRPAGRTGPDRSRRPGLPRRDNGGRRVTGLAQLAAAPQGAVLAAEDLSMFGTDPWWLVVVKAVFCFAFLMVTVLFSIVWERKVVAWMQLRIGPNRHGPWGMLQSLADGIKLMLKEDVVVKRADKVVYILAPIVAAAPAFMAIAVIPFGPAGNEVSIFGHRTTMQLTDLPIAMLYILAVASVGIYGIVLAGWSSGSTYPLLGGLRSCAQMISYEIAMGAAFASVFLYSGSMSTSEIVAAQEDRWFVLLLPVSFIIYIVTMVGETNRAPFDMPESEGDLVGGFNTEYSSIKFAMFMLAEYVNMVTVSAVSVTLFLGGWRAPYPISTFWEGANHGWWPMLWFVVKVQLLLFFFIWLRGTLPRVRYDQLMKLGWKVLIPVSVVWLMLVATVRALNNEGYDFAKHPAVRRRSRHRGPADLLRRRHLPRPQGQGRRGGGRTGAGVRPDGGRIPRAAAARPDAAAGAAPRAATRAGARCQWRAGYSE